MSEVAIFASRLALVPRELRREVRPRLRRAAEIVRQDAARRASWSSRIPGALRVGTSFGGGRAGGVFVRVDVSRAPHARPYEGLSRRSGRNFRHPVFGNRNVWVTQAARPFLMPAAAANRDRVLEEIGQAITVAAQRGGFH